MEISELQDRALRVRELYDGLNTKDGHDAWGTTEYLQGMVGDIGDLTKAIMAKNRKRRFEGDIDAKLRHELSDILWSILILAEELDIDLEDAFSQTMDELEARFS